MACLCHTARDPVRQTRIHQKRFTSLKASVVSRREPPARLHFSSRRACVRVWPIKQHALCRRLHLLLADSSGRNSTPRRGVFFDVAAPRAPSVQPKRAVSPGGGHPNTGRPCGCLGAPARETRRQPSHDAAARAARGTPRDRLCGVVGGTAAQGASGASPQGTGRPRF